MEAPPDPSEPRPPVVSEARSSLDRGRPAQPDAAGAIGQRNPYLAPRPAAAPPQAPAEAPAGGEGQALAGSPDDAVAFLAKASGAAELEAARAEAPAAAPGFVPPGFEQEEEAPSGRLKDLAVTLATMAVAFLLILALIFGLYRIYQLASPAVGALIGGAEERSDLYNITCTGISQCPASVLAACKLEASAAACLEVYNSGTSAIPGGMVVGAGVTIESEHGQTTFNSTRLLVVRDGSCEPLGACKECALAEWAPGATQTFAVVGTSIPLLKDAVHRIRPIIDRADLQQECTYGTDLV